MTKNQENTTEVLVEAIIEGLQENKAVDIVKIDLRKTDSAVCKYFVIREGTSSTHVNSMADQLEDYVRENAGEKIWKKGRFTKCSMDFVRLLGCCSSCFSKGI